MAKIYISATFQDLKSHREQVERVIRRMGHQDVAMEYYVAENQRPVAKCLEDVSFCDVYIGIYAWRYGWQPKEDNPGQLSITEMEYLEAHKLGKECLIFLLSEDAPWPKMHIDKDTTKIESFRNTASAYHTADYFVTADELARKIAEALHKWETRGLVQSDSKTKKLTVQQREDFAQLVVSSSLTLQRNYLCRRMGLKPESLSFVKTTSALDFAIELIAYCEEKELGESLKTLLRLVTQELKTSMIHQEKINNLQGILETIFLSTTKIYNVPSGSTSKHEAPSNRNKETHYTDAHIVSVLQIWTPMVIAWFLLLLLGPTLYQSYINRFRDSTARNIHISLSCFLTFLPLLILGLGANLETSYTGMSWLRIIWVAVMITWFATLLIGRIDIDEIGSAIGISIGILVSIVVGIEIPIVFDLPFGLITVICISVTGGTAYSVALLTINDRNVYGAGVGAFVAAILSGVILILTGWILSLTYLIYGGGFTILTVIGAMAFGYGAAGGLEKNIDKNTASRRGVFILVSYLLCLAALFLSYVL